MRRHRNTLTPAIQPNRIAAQLCTDCRPNSGLAGKGAQRLDPHPWAWLWDNASMNRVGIGGKRPSACRCHVLRRSWDWGLPPLLAYSLAYGLLAYSPRKRWGG